MARLDRDASRWLLGAAGLLSVGWLGLGGAAARPGGLLLGVPGFLSAGGVLVVVGLLCVTRRGREALAPCVGLLVPALVVLSGLSLAGVRAVSGPPLLALAGAGLAIAVVHLGWRPPRWVFVPAVFVLYAAVAGRVQLQVGPRGDEPHYLMVADSLLRDGDLSLEEDYAAQRYARFHDAPLAPHYRVRGKGGEIYSLHAVGLSLLILPAYALAGYTGASVFLALLAALLARELREWVRALSGRDGLADAAGWTFALSPPLIHYAGLVFTEVPAALAVAYGLRRGREKELGWGGALSVGLAAAALPWLNVRYVFMSGLVVLYAMWKQRRLRHAVALGVPALVSAVGLALFHQALYGFLDPRRVYGRRPELAWGTLREGIPGLLLDQEFGILVYAPLLILAVPGLISLWRRERALALTAGAMVAATVLTAGAWHMWRGGFNPPGRFLVPLVAVLGVGVGAVWERRGLSVGTALLIGWGVWVGVEGAWQPRLVHRDRDETAPLFRERSGAQEWTGLLPGYVLSDAHRDALAAVWMGALVLALPWRKKRASAGRLALAALAWMGVAELAASVAEPRTGDRDAVRLVGRTAVAVPGWEMEASAEGVWEGASLGWGPVYEPHRHPDGGVLGRRLTLPPADYELDILCDVLGAGPPGGWLEVVPEPFGLPRRRAPIEPRADGAGARFDVGSGERAVTLRLLGTEPLVLEQMRLRANPSGSHGSNRPGRPAVQRGGAGGFGEPEE